jgi:hypothetical protein
MQRALTLSLILYLPLLLAAAMEFASGASPDRIGSPAFIAFFLCWIADGAAAFVAGIAVGIRVAHGRYDGRERWARGLEAAAGFILGLAPFLILDELARKLYLLLTN